MTLENKNRELTAEKTELKQEQQLMVGTSVSVLFPSVRTRHRSGLTLGETDKAPVEGETGWYACAVSGSPPILCNVHQFVVPASG